MSLKLLHISDLHLTTDFFSPSTWITTSHDPYCFAALTNYWTSQSIDYLFVTGDIATDGQVKSFEHAKDFLLGQFQATTWQGNPMLGLDLKTFDRIFLVPGNHDRYLRDLLPFAGQIRNFEQVFGTVFQNAGRPRDARWMQSNDLRVRVLAFDSMGAAGATTAKGKVHEDDLDWLRTMYDADKRAKEQCDLRVAVLHHHVALPSNRQFKRLTRLKNMSDVIEDLLRADIDIVMFGHEHERYVGARTYADLIGDRRRCRNLEKNGYDVEKRLVTCMCGTTTQQGSGPRLAWHVVIDRTRPAEYELKFTLLEVNLGLKNLVPVQGEKEAIMLKRTSCRKAIGPGF